MYKNANPLVRPQNMSDGVGDNGVSGVDDVDESKQLEEEAEVVPESSETRKPQVARRPYTPTKAELESHLPLHLEYRSWCPHCRAGRGISMQHRSDDK